VRRHHEVRARREAGPLAEHASDAIDADVLDELLTSACRGRALFFLEWRGLDFADADLIVERCARWPSHGRGRPGRRRPSAGLADVGRTLLGKGCRHDGK
jgi:hypothetical protein